ncbi:hypothetical protein C8F01DRAFT_1345376 [Mycena amicta]|nr:hypothetical protein C8F01DRAFT_1345376 [Mycena amicta]
MPGVSKRLRHVQRLGQARRERQQDNEDSSSADENTPIPLQDSSNTRATRPRATLASQLVQKDQEIVRLSSRLSDLQAELDNLQVLQQRIESLQHERDALLQTKQTLASEKRQFQSKKRKADKEHELEVGRLGKRVKRLELERERRADGTRTLLDTQEAELDHLKLTAEKQSSHILELQSALMSAHSTLQSRQEQLDSLQFNLKSKQTTLARVRQALYAAEKREKTAKSALMKIQVAHRKLSVWRPKTKGVYGAEWRALARTLARCGCSLENLPVVVQAVADTVGARLKTNSWAGGRNAEEIMNSQGFVEASDGTSHRGITVEGRQITHKVPTYAPGVDDSDKTTWVTKTRFLHVVPAISHTAQAQFDGARKEAQNLADFFNRSPLAADLERPMEGSDDYYRNKLGDNRDHASDGKKGFSLSAAHKKTIVLRDLGRKAIANGLVDEADVLLKTLGVTHEELEAYEGITTAKLATLPKEEVSKIRQSVVEAKFGQPIFDAMTEEQQLNAITHVFGGCCSHKDLNVVRIAVAHVFKTYSIHGLTPPVLLANKANDAIIQLGEKDGNLTTIDSVAIQKALESSSRGAIKLLQLLGALLKHKDGERGYQERTSIFMRRVKLELYDLEESGEFTAVSNNRYGCYTEAAAEVIMFHTHIQELIEEIIDGKTQSGQANHVEKNVLKGLNDPPTMTENAALALYGCCVSWPYMAMVRGTRDAPINLISLTALHRRLPEFCAHLAANPHLLLDPDTPLDQLTLDGKLPRKHLLIPSIRLIQGDLPNLLLIISTMFAGAVEGWKHFTPEFQVGGTFDQLTPYQRQNLFLLSTNDVSEGVLGEARLHFRRNPNSSLESFSNKTRVRRNDTEAFIKKRCDDTVQRFVRVEVRRGSKTQRKRAFFYAWSKAQQKKASDGISRRRKTAERKSNTAAKLAAIQLELDPTIIEKMSSERLKEQLHVYRDVLRDEILLGKLWKDDDMRLVAGRRALVHAARLRELGRRATVGPVPSTEPGTGTLEAQLDENDEMVDDDADWVDTPLD